jgi:signal transduction histidine kinase
MTGAALVFGITHVQREPPVETRAATAAPAVSPPASGARDEGSAALATAQAEANAVAADHGRPGSVVIRLEAKGTEYHLIFADDAKGLPEESNITTTSGLGSRIVRGLVEQMAGTIRSQSSPAGTTVEIAIAARD